MNTIRGLWHLLGGVGFVCVILLMIAASALVGGAIGLLVKVL